MRKYWLVLLQGVFSLFLIWHLFHQESLRAEATFILKKATPTWLLFGLVTALFTEVLSAVRWFFMLRLFGTPLSLARCFVFCGAGLFFSLGLPGSGGGDAFRIFYMMRLYPKRKLSAALSVLADRLCGLVALIIALAITMILRHRLFAADLHARTILSAAIFMLSLSIVGLLLWWLTSFPYARSLWVPTMLKSFRKKGDRMGRIFSRLSHHPKLVIAGIILSLAALVTHFSTYFLSARSFSLPIRFTEIFTIMPVVDTLILLPVTLFGVGLRETLFVQLLGGLFHISSTAATLTSLGGFGLQACIALLGGLLIPFTLPSANTDKP